MANNLLVDWLNKKPKATLKNAQTVVNNNTASNMQNITTPTINAGSVAGVQQVNKPTLQVSAPLTTTNVKSSIQSNNPAFNNGALVTAQNQPSRFIGFQQQPQVANTVLDRTPNEKQGLSWNRLVNGGYNYVPSEVSKAETSNRAEENRYRTMSEAFYDLQGTLYNKGKVLGENELRQKFPEFKDLDINILNELQNELLPIVSSGKGVDADQISQIYPELLKGKELKDINTVKEKVQKGNDRYKGWEKAIQKVAKGDVEGMSSEGVQSVQDAKAIWQAVQAVKKDGVIGGGTDYEILRELYQRDPEIKRLMDDFNSRELTEKDKIIWGREDANKIGQLFRGATDWLRKDDEFMKSDEELESLKNKAEAMENDYWGQVAGTARVGLRSTADTWEKFIYRMSQDAKLWTIEDIDDYLKQSEENERNVAEYNASVDRETENVAQNTINQDVRDYYNNHTMSRSLALGDVPGFFLQSTKSATENVDMPIIIGLGVVAPEVVLPLMATDTYVRESEGAFEELLKNGASYDDAEQGAVTVGIANTVVELFLEKALGGVETTASKTIRDALMKDISKKTTEMVAQRGLAELLKQGAVTQFRSSLEEGLEEIVQQSIENYAVSKYNPDVKITDGLREAFEGGFFNPMNLLAGGGDIMSNVDVNALNQGAYNAGVRTREIVDNTKNSLNRGAYNAGSFLGNMTEDFKNSFTQGGTNNNQGLQQPSTVNTASENQNNINGENYNQNQKNSNTLNSVQLGLLKSNNRMNPTKITEFQEKFGKDYGQALADMGYTESQETNVPKIEQDTKEIYNEKKKAMNSVEGEFQDRSLRDMLNIMLKKAKNTLDYDMIDKYEKLKQKHNTKGLTMAEANDMREEFSYKVKTRWGGDGNSDKIDLANNVYTAVKNFLEKTAEANGIKDLQKMNRDIAMRKYLSTRIGDKAERQSANNMVSLTDWVILAEAVSNPYAAAGFVAKKIVQKPKVKNAVLNAVVGRRENRTIDQQNRQVANKERMENIESANRGKELQQELTPSNILALPNGIKLTKVTEIDARKPKNKVTKKNNNKKSDSSSSDDGGTPTGGTPAGTNPTNNQGGTPTTDDTKNAVTKKKSETKKQVKNAITNQKSGLTADENAKLREGISILQEVKQEVNDSNFEGIVDIVNRLGEEKTKQVIKDMNDLRRKLENISERQAELGKDTRADRSVLHDLRGQILFLEYALNEKSNIGKTADGLDKVANHSRPSKTLRGLIADEIEKYKYQDNDARIDMSIKTIRDEKLVRGALYGYMTDALAPTNRAAELGGNILRKVGIDPTEYEQEASNAPTHYTDGKANEYKTPEERAKNKVTAKKKAEATTKQEENKIAPITKDSEGNTLSAEDQERFGNSKLVNDKGELIVVMHGTPIQEAFNEYDESKAGSNVQADFKGIYFTDNLELADQFSHEQLPGSSAFRVRLGERGHIYKSYLNMENPLDLNTATPEQLLGFFREDVLTKNWDEAKRLDNLSGHPQFIKFHVDMNKVEAAGYDGIIAKIGKEGEGNEYIVFKGNQAKNIGEVENQTKEEQPKNKVTSKKSEVTQSNPEEQARNKAIQERERLDNAGIKPVKSLPQGHKWNENGAFTITTPGGSKLIFLPIGDNLYIKNWAQVWTKDVNNTVIENYKQWTANELTNFINGDLSDGDVAGSIMTDAWHKMGLPLGLNQNILKPLNPAERTQPKNAVTAQRAEVTAPKETKVETKTEEKSDLRSKLGDKFYEYMEKQLELTNKSREGMEKVTMEELLPQYIDQFEEIAQKEVKEIQEELNELTKDRPEAKMTDAQREQLNGITDQNERNKLLKKWQDEWIKEHPISDEDAAKVGELMERAAEAVEGHKKARNYLYELEEAQENKENEDHFSYDTYGDILKRVEEAENKINEEFDKKFEEEYDKKKARFDELNAKDDTDRSDGSEIAKLANDLNNMRNKYDKLKEDAFNKRYPDLVTEKARQEELFNKDWKKTYRRAVWNLENGNTAKNKVTNTAKNKVTNITVTQGEGKKVDNSGITGKFRNLTAEEYRDMQKFGGLEELYLEGRTDLIQGMLELKDSVGYLDPAEYGLPEDFEIDYHNYWARTNGKLIIELDQLLERIEKGVATEEDKKNHDEFWGKNKKGEEEWDTHGIIETQKDMLSEMVNELLGEEVGNKFISDLYDQWSVANSEFKGNYLSSSQVDEINNNMKKIEGLVSKYGRYWNQGEKISPSTKEIWDKQDLARNLDNNETPQIPTIFEEDLEEMNLRQLDENETPQINEEEIENSINSKKETVTPEYQEMLDKMPDDGRNYFIYIKVGDKYYIEGNPKGRIVYATMYKKENVAKMLPKLDEHIEAGSDYQIRDYNGNVYYQSTGTWQKSEEQLAKERAEDEAKAEAQKPAYERDEKYSQIKDFIEGIDNKAQKTKAANKLLERTRWKLDDGKIVNRTKAEFLEYLVKEQGKTPKEFPTGKTYPNGEPKVEYMIVNDKNIGYKSSKIENDYARSLLETPEEQISKEDEAKLDELFTPKTTTEITGKKNVLSNDKNKITSK